MTTESVNNMELVSLSDFFSPKKFRLIPDDALTRRGGVSEVQVVFHLRKKFTQKLNFECSSILVLYGYAVMNDRLKEINQACYTIPVKDSRLKKIELNDCGERFVMVLSLRKEKELLYAVDAHEVADLLNNCMHPNGWK